MNKRIVFAILLSLLGYAFVKALTRLLSFYEQLPIHVSENSWILAVEHHLIQLGGALVLITIASRGKYQEWGLTMKRRWQSIKLFKKFSYYYLLYFIGISFLIQLIIYYPGPPFEHTFNSFQVLGYLSFGFLLTGLSEEILFRGFIHTVLYRATKKTWTIYKIKYPVAGLIASLIFCLAHVGISFFPFEIYHLNPLQLLQAFVLGLFYSYAYYRTGSLLAPILAHNLSNGSLWAMDYLLYWLKM